MERVADGSPHQAMGMGTGAQPLGGLRAHQAAHALAHLVACHEAAGPTLKASDIPAAHLLIIAGHGMRTSPWSSPVHVH